MCGFEQIMEVSPPQKQQLYSHLPPISQTIQVIRTRHYWNSKNELISDIIFIVSYTWTRHCEATVSFVQKLYAV